MKKFIVLLLCTAISKIILSQNVVQGEYFIDTDLGFGNNTLVNFTPASDSTFSFNIDLSGYQPGYHKLYIRTKDDNGNWSITARRNIEVLASDAKTTIVSGEYFIDSDPGFGMGNTITISSPDSIILQNFTAVASSLSEGYHKLYGRFKDNLGRWSQTFRRNMEVFKSVNTNVVKIEYFFDTDLGFGNCASVAIGTPSPDGSFTFNIPKSQIPMGADSLFVRVQNDVENRWSITQIFNNINSILPLTLLDFTAIKQHATTQLNWQTENEVNTSHFNIQRSTDGTNFITIGKVNAKINSGLKNDYGYTDDISNLSPGKIFYRLQMMDSDGKFTFSKIVSVTIDENNLQLSIHPNPAHSYFVISNYDKAVMKNSIINVTDLSGRTLISRKFTDNSQQNIDISALAKGMYIVNIITNGNVNSKKLIVE